MFFLPGLGFDHIKTKPLTVLSFSGGQESFALLILLFTNKRVWDKYVGDSHPLVVMADTGNEHDETYDCVERARQLCKEKGVDFCLITKDLGHHTPAWQSLSEQYERTSTLGSASFRTSCCTLKLKIGPIYKYIESYVSKNWGFPTAARGKKAIKALAKKYGKIKMMIGFNVDEADRRITPAKNEDKWQKESVEKVYPLAELKITRQISQDIIRGAGEVVPPPSHCKFCHYQSVVEIYHKFRYDKEIFRQLCRMEAAKLLKFAYLKEKNLGFFGSTKTVMEYLKIAIEKPVKKSGIDLPLKEWTKEMLDDYRMSHGHCMSGGY